MSRPRRRVPVMLLPGYGADDRSTWPLRTYLERPAHDACGWGPGTNRGDAPGQVTRVGKLVAALAERKGRAVALVGWSLGDYDGDEIERRVAERKIVPLRVPVTAIYSRRDGIVSWRACIDDEDNDLTEHVEVTATHLDPGFTAEVLRIVAERLAGQRPSSSAPETRKRASTG